MRDFIKHKNKIVVKVGTSTLTYSTGKINFQQIENLAETISDLLDLGKKVILVSSGAIGVGSGKIGLTSKPDSLSEKQALAAIGQAELIKIYRRFFAKHNKHVGQVLLTKDCFTDKVRKGNATNTLNALLDMGIIPIVNENDTVATHEILFGDNDTMSADVAVVSASDLLVILSDIDALYTANPRVDKNAKPISSVNKIDSTIEALASGEGSAFGTGGMKTKISAAKICMNSDISMVIASGSKKGLLKDILNGDNVGTLFTK